MKPPKKCFKMWMDIQAHTENNFSWLGCLFACFGFKSPLNFHKHWTEKSTSLFRPFFHGNVRVITKLIIVINSKYLQDKHVCLVTSCNSFWGVSGISKWITTIRKTANVTVDKWPPLLCFVSYAQNVSCTVKEEHTP